MYCSYRARWLASLAIALVIYFTNLGSSVCAQDTFEQTKPKELEKAEREHKLPGVDGDVPGDDKIILKELKGVIFLTPADKVLPDTKGMEGVQADKIALLNNAVFKTRIAAFLGKPASMKSLNQIVRATILYYREQDRPLVDVLVPEQDVTTGVVQFFVLEAKVGKVRIEGNKWFSESVLRRGIKTGPGDTILASQVLKDLDTLNRNAFRDVDVLFTPGAEKGLTDIVYTARDRFPVRIYGGYEDSGTQLTGQDRVIGGFNWGNAFFQDHELGYQYTTDITHERYRAHSAYYRVPLPLEGQQITLFGSHATTEAPVNQDFNSTGINWQIGMRYQALLPEVGIYKESLTGGFDFKRSNNNLAFGGASVFQSATDVVEFSLDYTGNETDRYGKTAFSITGFESPGGMTEHQRDRNYRAARARADANFLYGTMTLERTWALPRELSFYTKVTGQLSTENLLPSEQMGFGGYSTIRGYDEREYNADQGLIANIELRSPKFFLGNLGSKPEFASALQVLAFYDYGMGRNRRLSAHEVTPDFASVGLGGRYNLGTHLSIRVDYGWRLERGFQKNDGGRIHLGVVASF